MPKSLGDYLKAKRGDREMTQYEVARALGYSTAQFISNWERNISKPPVETLKKITKLYKIKPDEIFKIYLEGTLQERRGQVMKDFSRVFRKK